MNKQVRIKLNDEQEALINEIKKATCFDLASIANMGVRKALAEYQSTRQITVPAGAATTQAEAR